MNIRGWNTILHAPRVPKLNITQASNRRVASRKIKVMSHLVFYKTSARGLYFKSNLIHVCHLFISSLFIIWFTFFFFFFCQNLFVHLSANLLLYLYFQPIHVLSSNHIFFLHVHHSKFFLLHYNVENGAAV